MGGHMSEVSEEERMGGHMSEVSEEERMGGTHV